MNLESNSPEPQHSVSEADFVRLFARHELALRNYARLILPDWSGVDDVLQDASVTMWESRQRLRDESGFLPWGKVIVRHKCFNAIAKMRRDRLVLDKDVLELIAGEEDADTVSDDLSRIHLSLTECLGELTPERRELVMAPYRGAGAVKQLAEQGGIRKNEAANAKPTLRDDGRTRGDGDPDESAARTATEQTSSQS